MSDKSDTPEGHTMRPAWILTLLGALFSGCATKHEPEREGVWIERTTPMVRCWQTPEGTVCRSDRRIPTVELGI